MTLKTSITLDLAALLTGALDLQGLSAPAALKRVFSFTDGAGAGQANRIFADRRTIAASGSEDIDLNGTLTDAFGAALTFARIRALIVAADKNNTNNVVLGGVASGLSTILQPAASGLAVVRPGGLFCVVAPDATAYAVTATSADLLHVANSGAGSGVTYDVVVIGSAT